MNFQWHLKQFAKKKKNSQIDAFEHAVNKFSVIFSDPNAF